MVTLEGDGQVPGRGAPRTDSLARLRGDWHGRPSSDPGRSDATLRLTTSHRHVGALEGTWRDQHAPGKVAPQRPLESSEYRHIALDLVFLKYSSDAFEQRHSYLVAATADPGSDYYTPEPSSRHRIAESRDEYTSEAVFWVPEEARWPYLQAKAKQPEIGLLIDAAMDAIERDNPSLKGVLPKDQRPKLGPFVRRWLDEVARPNLRPSTYTYLRPSSSAWTATRAGPRPLRRRALPSGHGRAGAADLSSPIVIPPPSAR